MFARLFALLLTLGLLVPLTGCPIGLGQPSTGVTPDDDDATGDDDDATGDDDDASSDDDDASSDDDDATGDDDDATGDDDDATGDDDDATGDDDDSVGDDDDSTAPPLTCQPLTTLTAGSGSFEDGSGASDYGNNLVCGWLIDLDAATYEGVELSFSAFDVEQDYDFVRVYDGANTTATELAELTGGPVSDVFTSTGPQLYVEFTTDSTVGAAGFMAAWQGILIGGGDDDDATGDDDDSTGSGLQCDPLTTLTAASGTFEDGSGAGIDYDNDLLCGWLIDVDSTLYQDITLSFVSFALENSYDFLEVYDGADANAPSLASLTGSSLPADVTSTGTQLYIEFITDVSLGDEGFEAAWVANPIVVTPPTCSGTTTLTSATGTFEDGSGAGVDYDNNLSCGWLIDVSTGTYQDITLSFSSFDLENTYDFVNVYDGADANAPLLQALTGTSLPADITSTGTQLFVELVTDSIVTADGFSASWTANLLPPPATCSGTTTFTTGTGSFDDGSGPGVDYSDNLSCGWLIDVDATQFQDITLSFSSFELENNFDYVNVYDGADANAPLLADLTGSSLPADITSSGTQLFVEFVTDSGVNYEGFDASWVANLLPPPPTCSGTTTFTAAAGTFDDGSGPGADYSNGVTCGWLIDVDSTLYQDITLSFSSFDLENTYDFVNVYDGADANATQLASLTGSSLPSNVTSTGTQMYVEIVTDSIISADGFSAGWTANAIVIPPTCSGTTTLTGPTGTFDDGSGPGTDYDNNLLCGWLIDVDATQFQDITLSFSSFDVENTYDFVNVYDGADANAPLLQSLTGTSLPADITSAGTQLFVELVTDNIIGAEGFDASWTANLPPPPTGCSGTTLLTADVGFFDDGSGAGNYSANSSCGWLIDYPGMEGVTLEFTAFDTEADYDFVTIYDGTNNSAPVIAEFSGSNVPLNTWVVASFDSIYVEFTSDSSINAPGFEALYETWGTTDECTGTFNLTDEVGIISDGGGNYSNNALCGWSIDIEEAAGVEFVFDFLETEANFDYVDIFDGADDNAALLVSYDGLISPAPTVTTTFGQAFVQLDTDGSITDPGFTALYSAVYVNCSGPYTMTANTGGFGDGSGPNGNYVTNQECSWLIDGPPGSTISVTAVYWDVEQTWDTIELRDGGTSSAPLLTTWTGSGSNDTWMTTGSQAFVEWDSDFSVTAPGFWIEYVVIP